MYTEGARISTLSARLAEQEKRAAGDLTSTSAETWSGCADLRSFPYAPGPFPACPSLSTGCFPWARVGTRNSQGAALSAGVLRLPARCSSFLADVLIPGEPAGSGPGVCPLLSISPTCPSAPSLRGAGGVCPSLKSNVEVRVKGEDDMGLLFLEGKFIPLPIHLIIY